MERESGSTEVELEIEDGPPEGRDGARYEPGQVHQFPGGGEARFLDAEVSPDLPGIEPARRAEHEQPEHVAGLDEVHRAFKVLCSPLQLDFRPLQVRLEGLGRKLMA